MTAYWIVGALVVVAVGVGFSLYHRRLEDQGYWVPNSMKDTTMAVVILLLLALILLPSLLEMMGR